MMRTVTHGDVVAAAGVARGIAGDERRTFVLRLLERAHAADKYRKRTGRAHPLWGDGTLMAVARKSRIAQAEPFLSDVEYLETIATVIETLLFWRQRASSE
jgi:hypothetical protein